MLLDYSMTKGAQVAMVRVLSNQLLPKGIRVKCASPPPSLATC
jgi:NAD(P)-dependent dehydrogenase (short-subunit alcohol dehydrogenase family)